MIVCIECFETSWTPWCIFHIHLSTQLPGTMSREEGTQPACDATLWKLQDVQRPVETTHDVERWNTRCHEKKNADLQHLAEEIAGYFPSNNLSFRKKAVDSCTSWTCSRHLPGNFLSQNNTCSIMFSYFFAFTSTDLSFFSAQVDEWFYSLHWLLCRSHGHLTIIHLLTSQLWTWPSIATSLI